MDKMANPHKSTTAAARRRTVAEKYLRGEHQADIAREVGVSQPMISKDLKIIRAQWKASSIRDYDTLKAQEIARVDAVEAAAWIGYAKSELDGLKTVREQSPLGEKVSVTTERRAGNTTWLGVILACIAQRTRLLGLEEQARYTVNWDSISTADLERLAAGEPARDVLSAVPPSMAEA